MLDNYLKLESPKKTRLEGMIQSEEDNIFQKSPYRS